MKTTRTTGSIEMSRTQDLGSLEVQYNCLNEMKGKKYLPEARGLRSREHAPACWEDDLCQDFPE